MSPARALRIGPYGWRLALAVAVAVAAAEVVTLTQRTDEWTSSLGGTVLWQSGAVRIAAPLLAGVAAAVAVVLRRSAVGTLGRVAGREVPMLAGMALRIGSIGLAVHVVALVAAVLVTRGEGLQGLPPLEAAVPGAAALLAWPVLGAAAGWHLRHVAAAPLTVLVAFLVMVPGAALMFTSALEVGGDPDAVGFEAVPWWIVASATAFALLAATAMGTVLPRAALRARRLGVPVGVAGVLVVVGLAPSDLTREDHRSLACAGDRPAVCVYPERRGRVAETRERLVAMSATFERLVPGSMDGLERWTEGWAPLNRGTAALTIADPEDRASLTQDVVAAAGRCGGTSVDGFLQLWIDRHLGDGARLAPVEVGVDVPDGYLDAGRFRRLVREAVDGISGRCSR